MLSTHVHVFRRAPAVGRDDPHGRRRPSRGFSSPFTSYCERRGNGRRDHFDPQARPRLTIAIAMVTPARSRPKYPSDPRSRAIQGTRPPGPRAPEWPRRVTDESLAHRPSAGETYSARSWDPRNDQGRLGVPEAALACVM